MLDATYSPQPLGSKPDWFNGFIRLEKHKKEKYNWYRYVYLPDYYTDSIGSKSITSESRFGNIAPDKEGCDFISKHFQSYYNTTETKHFGTGTKKELGGRTIGTIVILNTATGEEEQHRYFYADGEYIVRQLSGYDRPQIKDALVYCSKEFERFYSMAETLIMLENGMLIAPFNTEGEMKGIQAFIVSKDHVAPEPMGYIDSEASGKGIFNIYNDFTIELGKAVEAEYIYAQCLVKHEKMRAVYEAYGYIRDKEIKSAGKTGLMRYYTFRYPLITKQQSFF